MPPDVPATVKANVPLVVIGEPDTEIKPPVNDCATLVTVPLPPVAAQLSVPLPLFVRTPEAFAGQPDMPVTSGNPVAFVRTSADGVPSAGVTSVGEVANTTLPLPVVAVTESVPAPPDVVTIPLLVRLLSVAMFWLVLTVIVFVLLVSPVLNVIGTS